MRVRRQTCHAHAVLTGSGMPSDMGAEFARNSDSLKGMVAALPCDLHGPPGNLAMRPPGENGMPDDEDTPPASLLRDAAGLFAAACAREPGRMPPEEIPKTLMACFAARPPAMRMPWNGWWTPTRAAAFCSRTWFRRIGRQRQQNDVVRDGELRGGMPACAVHYQHGDGAHTNAVADLCKVLVHRFKID